MKIKMLLYSATNSSYLVKQAIEKGVLERRTAHEDKRVGILSLTDKGRALYEDAATRVEAVVNSSGLGEVLRHAGPLYIKY